MAQESPPPMLVIFLLFSTFSLSSSAPIIFSGTESDRALHMPSGRGPPECAAVGRCRTLQGVAWSCVVTIFACTWVAVHPNLPGPGDPALTRWRRRLLTMMYAMIAPEFVTVWAWRQFVAARKIEREMNGIREYRSIFEWWNQDPRDAPKEWTLTHGFFVQAGGFILYDGEVARQVLTFSDLKRMKERKEQQEWDLNLGGWAGESEKQLRERERELGGQLMTSHERMRILREKLETLRKLEWELQSVRRSELLQAQVVKQAQERVEMLRKRQTGDIGERATRPGLMGKFSRSKWELKHELKHELKRKTRAEQRLQRLRERLQELQQKRESEELRLLEVGVLERQVELAQEQARGLQLELERRRKQLREMKKQKGEWMQKRVSGWGHWTRSELAQEWEQEWDRRKQERLAFAIDADLPTIPEHEINDKAKGDFLTKSFVVIQMSWFIVQCFARGEAGLPITELEVITLAFAALNIITYILWWKKPKDVLVAVRVQLKSDGDKEKGEAGSSTATQSEGGTEGEGVLGRKRWLSRKLEEAKTLKVAAYRLVQATLRPFGKMRGYGPKPEPRSLRVGTFYADDSGGNGYIAILLIALAFGFVHLIPWSFTFPSTAERRLWRMFALFLILIPVMVYLRDLVLNLNERHPTKYSKFFVQVTTSLASLGLPLYILTRLSLFILAFSVLRNPPPDVYLNVEWLSFVPHV